MVRLTPSAGRPRPFSDPRSEFSQVPAKGPQSQKNRISGIEPIHRETARTRRIMTTLAGVGVNGPTCHGKVRGPKPGPGHGTATWPIAEHEPRRNQIAAPSAAAKLLLPAQVTGDRGAAWPAPWQPRRLPSGPCRAKRSMMCQGRPGGAWRGAPCQETGRQPTGARRSVQCFRTPAARPPSIRVRVRVKLCEAQRHQVIPLFLLY